MPTSKFPSWIGLVAMLALLLLGSACNRAAPKLTGELQRQTAWDPDFVDEFGSTMVMNDGRVQPISTLAAFTLYAVHGRRDVQFETDDRRTVKLSPTEW
ncbi:MAG: hypothetical protein JNL12_16745, partial [Planctomycetes bacterium]|nr:hypothetical protein [Planctomycetota bacterium]